jgi:hypothetical protein
MAVSLALWTAGLYWLWRFYQYSRPFFASTIRTAIQSYTQKLAPPVAMRKILRENPSLSEPFEDAPEITPQFSYADLAQCGQGSDYLDIEMSLNKSASSPHSVRVQGTVKYRVKLVDSELRPLRRRAWLHLVVHTTHFTDLILPYVLFGLPVTYLAYKGIRTLM